MKNKLLASGFLGLLFAFFGYFVLLLFEIENPLYMSFLCGVLAFAMLMMVFIASEENSNRRFRKIEQEINLPILFKADGNFNLGHSIISGRVYFYEEMLVLASVEKKSPMVEGIPKGMISRYEIENITAFHIYTTDFRKFVLATADAEKIADFIENNNWL